jgi:hypothetical protein
MSIRMIPKAKEDVNLGWSLAAGKAWSHENDLGWSICPIFPRGNNNYRIMLIMITFSRHISYNAFDKSTQLSTKYKTI